MSIVENVQRVLFQEDLLVRAEIAGKNKIFMVRNDQLAFSARFGNQLGSRSALHAMRRPLAKFGVVRLVRVCRRNQKSSSLPCSFAETAYVWNDFFGARNIQFSARQHEVRLHVHFP